MANNITPQQRALNFGAYTRQHIQTLGSKTGEANAHIDFEVPKARLLQGVSLLVEVDAKPTKNVTYSTLNEKMELYDVLRRVSIDYNNGFSPVTASGKDIAVANMLRINPDTVVPSVVENTLCTIKGDCYAYGDGEEIAPKVNDFGYVTNEQVNYTFMLELPLTLNDRDPAGLVLAQNGQTLININVDINDKLGDVLINNVKVTPVLTSFSVPPISDAFPDLSVLKILDSRTETISQGQNVIKLPTGMIYRKLIIYLEDENGNPITPDKINSNIELIFNTADIPYSVNATALRFRTSSQVGGELPAGYYIFDYSYQGISNLGGSRDYVDTERLTSFEVRFTTTVSGKCKIIAEKISRLIASK